MVKILGALKGRSLPRNGSTMANTKKMLQASELRLKIILTIWIGTLYTYNISWLVLATHVGYPALQEIE